LPEEARLRRVRVVRDYGMFDRRKVLPGNETTIIMTTLDAKAKIWQSYRAYAVLHFWEQAGEAR